jgi:carbohydrate-selective porin OprB
MSYYTYRPLNGFEMRPNIQYVTNPGGTSQNRNALVLGLKTVANFRGLLTVPASIKADYNTLV